MDRVGWDENGPCMLTLDLAARLNNEVALATVGRLRSY